MRTRLAALVGPLSGVAFMAVMIGSMSAALPHTISPDQPPEQVAEQIARYADGLGWSARLTLLAALLIVVFGAWLTSRLLDGERRWRPAVALLPALGAVLMAALLCTQATFMFLVSEPDLYEHAPGAAHMVLAISWEYAQAFGPGIAALLIGCMIAAFDRHVVPRIFGALALVVLAAMLVVGAGLGAGLGMAWIALLSAWLAIQQLRAPRAG